MRGAVYYILSTEKYLFHNKHYHSKENMEINAKYYLFTKSD